MEHRGFYYSGPPEYFPGVDFFAGVSGCRSVILRTDLQYSRQSFQNRTKIRTPDGWQWLTIPVVGGQYGRCLSETEIDESSPWRKKHLQALRFNYQSSPFFDYIEPDLEAFFRETGSTVGEVAAASVVLLANLLGTGFDVVVDQPAHDSESVITTINAQEEYGLQEIGLEGRAAGDVEGRVVVVPEVPPYRQNFEGFVPDMSALDLMCNYGPEANAILSDACRVIT